MSWSFFVVLLVSVCSVYSDSNEYECNVTDILLAPTVLSDLIILLKKEANDVFLSSSFNKILNEMIQENEEIDCEFTELYYERFLTSNTFSFIFSDLCNHVFVYDINDDDDDDIKYQKLLINDHLKEDGSHLNMWYNDWNELNLNNIDEKIGVNDLIVYFFGKQLSPQRNALYHIMRLDAKYGGDINPIIRYVLIIMIEFSGKSIFEKQTVVYNIYRNNCKSPKILHFCAKNHSDVETGNLFLRDKNLEQYIHLFDNYIIQTNEEILLLLEMGRSVYKKIEGDSLKQTAQFVQDGYKQQNIWQLGN